MGARSSPPGWVDRLPARLGIAQAFTGDETPSRLAGQLLVFFVMLFAAVEAANRLGFVRMADLVSTFIRFGGEILLGSVIIVVGFWLSNLPMKASCASTAPRRSRSPTSRASRSAGS